MNPSLTSFITETTHPRGPDGPTISPGKLCRPRLLIVLEGLNDCEFLRRLATVLRQEGEPVPDLARLEQQGAVILLPVGGGDLAAWARRLAPLQLPEFHLYDKEQSPETESRQSLIQQINQRSGCLAALTRKRSLENYLHPQAIRDALGVELAFGDETPLAEALAERCHQQAVRALRWKALPRRRQKNLVQRAKRRLNTCVVTQMTVALLTQRDPRGEIRSWFAAIGQMLRGEWER